MNNQSALIAFLSLLLLCLPNTSFNLSAQIMPDKIIVDGRLLYNENGEELTIDQIKSLSAYGFDYDRYCTLKRWYGVTIVTDCLCGAIICIGGFIGRKGDKGSVLESMMLSGLALGLGGAFFRFRIEDSIKHLVSDMKDSPQLSFTPSGFGLVYTF